MARKADFALLASSAFLLFFLGLGLLALEILDEAVLLRAEDQHVAGRILQVASDQQEEGFERHDGAAERQIDGFCLEHAAHGDADGENAGARNQHRHEIVDDQEPDRDDGHDRCDEVDLLHAGGAVPEQEQRQAPAHADEQFGRREHADPVALLVMAALAGEIGAAEIELQPEADDRRAKPPQGHGKWRPLQAGQCQEDSQDRHGRHDAHLVPEEQHQKFVLPMMRERRLSPCGISACGIAARFAEKVVAFHLLLSAFARCHHVPGSPAWKSTDRISSSV